MSTEIGPGTPLICINNGASSLYVSGNYGPILTIGALYFCEEIVNYSDIPLVQKFSHCTYCGKENIERIVLRDIKYYHPNEQIPLEWCIHSFRPLNDGDTSLIENEKEHEDGSSKASDDDGRTSGPRQRVLA